MQDEHVLELCRNLKKCLFYDWSNLKKIDHNLLISKSRLMTDEVFTSGMIVMMMLW